MTYFIIKDEEGKELSTIYRKDADWSDKEAIIKNTDSNILFLKEKIEEYKKQGIIPEIQIVSDDTFTKMEMDKTLSRIGTYEMEEIKPSGTSVTKEIKL